MCRGHGTDGSVSSQRAPLQSPCAWAAALLPLSLALSRLDGAERWEQDIAVVRALGLTQVGSGGVLSSGLSGVFSLLPVGNVLWRLSLFSALAVSLASVVIYHFALRLLAGQAGRGTAPLALAAALMATLGSAWQGAATLIGSPAFAALLVLLVIGWLPAPRELRGWLGHGFALGLLTLESLPCAAAAALTLAIVCLSELRLPTLLQAGAALFTWGLTWALGALPSFVASGASAFVALGSSLNAADTYHFAVRALPIELGFYVAALATLGAVAAWLRPAGFRVALPLGSWIALGWLQGDKGGITLVAVAASAVLASLGLAATLDFARRRTASLARTLRRVAVIVHLGALLLIAEGGDQAGRGNEQSATRAWSEEAFERLPQNSLLLLSSSDAAWRIWSSRLTAGLRPDVLVIPTSLLGEGAMARNLLSLEPRLAPLIRDEATHGLPSEYSLTELADARPLRVEADADWNRPLLRHLEPDGLWFRFASHTPGRVDRELGGRRLRRAVARVAKVADQTELRDTRTLQRLADDLARQAAVAVALGDTAMARGLTRRLKLIDPRHHDLLALRNWLKQVRPNPANLGQALRGPEQP